MRGVLLVLVALALPVGPALAACAGDCDGDGAVAVNEVVRAVGIALGNGPVSQCAAADANGDGGVTIAELVGAVGAALGGCAGAPTRTPTPTPTGDPNVTPTVFVPGCDNGTFALAYADVSGTNAVTTPLTLDLVAAGQVRDARTGLYLWLLNGLECVDNRPGLQRNVQVQYLGARTGFAPGTYTLTPPLSYFLYVEGDGVAGFQRTWDTTAATLTVEEVAGERLRFRLSAAMKPQPLTSFGQQPQGTFTLTVTGTVQRFTSQ